MKKYAISLLITVVVFMGFSSCSDDFLEQIPTEDTSALSVPTTTGNLMLAINGIHRSLYLRYGSQGRGGLGAMMIQTEMLGEDLVMTSANDNTWFNTMYKWLDHTNASDGDNLFPYRVYYRIVRNANIIINGAVNAVGSDEERNIALGQALVYRAFCFFQLVQLYGGRYEAGGNNTQLGVPIPLVVDGEDLPRAAVEEVYTQIHQDLDEAILLLEAYNRSNASHLDQRVALGLKARIALVQGNWNLASESAQQARDGYELMNNEQYRSGFNDYTNPEWMWGSHIQEDQTLYFANYGAFMSRNFSSTDIRTNPKAINVLLYDMIPDTDIRSTLFDPTGTHTELSLESKFKQYPYTSQKFLAAGSGDSRMDVPYMRAAEMYLIEAEAKARLGAPDAAQVLFELVSNRDSAYVLSGNTGQALIDEVLIQRRIELWGEGFRFYDLKRLDAPLNRNGSNHNANYTGGLLDVPAGDNRWQWLIPQDEINANPLIEQNPI